MYERHKLGSEQGSPGAINGTAAINEERLTDAPVAINAFTVVVAGGREGRDVVGQQEVNGGIQGKLRESPRHSRVGNDKTANRRSREAYNAYMRDYMRAYRGRQREG